MSGLKRSNSCRNVSSPKAQTPIRSRSCERINDSDTSQELDRSTSLEFIDIGPSTSTGIRSRSREIAVASTGAIRKVRTPRSGPSRQKIKIKFPFTLGCERQINNEQWVLSNYYKVVNYLSKHPKCDKKINVALRSTKTDVFVPIMDILFKEIDPSFDINLENYDEVISETLEFLHYPLTVSKDMLKNVQKNNSWTEIISIYSWLTELIRVVIRMNDHFLKELKFDEKMNALESLIQFIITKYMNYILNVEEDPEAEAEFIEKYGSIINLQIITEFVHSESENQNTLTRRENKQQAVRNLVSRQTVLNKQIENIRSSIEDVNIKKEGKAKVLESEIASAKVMNAQLAERVNEARASVSRLDAQLELHTQANIYRQRLTDEMRTLRDQALAEATQEPRVLDPCVKKILAAKKLIEFEIYRLTNQMLKLLVLDTDNKIAQLKQKRLSGDNLAEDLHTTCEYSSLFQEAFTDTFNDLYNLCSDLQDELRRTVIKKQVNNEGDNELTEEETALLLKVNTLEEIIRTMRKRKEGLRVLLTARSIEFRNASHYYYQFQNRYKFAKSWRGSKVHHVYDKLHFEVNEYFKNLNNTVFTSMDEMNDFRSECVEFLTKCVKRLSGE